MFILWVSEASFLIEVANSISCACFFREVLQLLLCFIEIMSVFWTCFTSYEYIHVMCFINLYSCFDDSVYYLLAYWFCVSFHFYDCSNTSICVIISSTVLYLIASWFVVLVFDYDIFCLFCLVMSLCDSEYLYVVVYRIFAFFLSLLFVSASLYVKRSNVTIFHN